MSANTQVRRGWVALLSMGLILPGGPVRAAEQTVELRSRGSYQSYRLPDDTTEVELVDQLQGACRFNRSWGYDLSNKELWVNSGCGGRFKITTEASSGDKSSNVGAAVAAAAVIAGIAILASRNKDKHKDEDYNDSGNGWGGQSIRGLRGLCLDIAGGVRPGNALNVYNCHNGANQRFEWGRRGELLVGGLCLDVVDGRHSDGTRVIAWHCNGQRNQRWRVDDGQIISEDSGKCLDLQDGRARPGQQVQIWRCNGQSNQRWNW